MEVLLKRFPLACKKIFINLDDQTLVRSKEASRGLFEFLQNNKLFWIRIMRKYKRNFEGLEESWNQVIKKTPLKFVKQLAVKTEESFEYGLWFNEKVAPLHIAVERRANALCESIIRKSSDKNPANNFGTTPLHMAAEKGQFDLCQLILKDAQNKNPGNKSGWTPLHYAARDGHLDVSRLVCWQSLKKEAVSFK